MKRLLFGQLVTMDGDPHASALENGELIVSGETISAINTDISAEFDGETIDLTDHLILPGFVNAHCHLSLSGLRGKIPQGLGFVDWIRQVVGLNMELPFTERVAALQEGARALLASGVTTLVDYMSHPELIPEYARLSFRQVLLYEVLGFQKNKADEVAHRAETLLQEHTGHGGKIRLGLAAHAPYSVSPQLFGKLQDLADKYGCLLSCHVAEVPEESEFLKTGGGPFRELLDERGVWEETWAPPGQSPVEYLGKMAMLETMQSVHVNCLEESDTRLIEDGQMAGAVFCPGSTRWFGRGSWMPVRRLLDAGIPVGLGTDSLASNDRLNFLREVRLADAMLPDVSRAEILWMATAAGAIVSDLDGGELVAGGRADLLVFRLAETKPRTPWWDVVLDHTGAGPDRMMIAGEWVANKKE